MIGIIKAVGKLVRNSVDKKNKDLRRKSNKSPEKKARNKYQNMMEGKERK